MVPDFRGEAGVLEYLKSSAAGKVAIGFSPGMPMSFYDDPELKAGFLEIARVHHCASDRIGVLPHL